MNDNVKSNAPAEKRGCATASMIFGVIAATLTWVAPGLYSIISGVAAIALYFPAKNASREDFSRNMATAGLTLGIISVIISAILYVANLISRLVSYISMAIIFFLAIFFFMMFIPMFGMFI